MKLTSAQRKAYDDIFRWMQKEDKWCYNLSGFAGTGKTTLLQQIINNMDKAPYCCAPTAKAGSVLEKKLEDSIVTTVHKALYSPIEKDMEYYISLVEALKQDPNNQELKQKLEREKQAQKKNPVSFSSKVSPGEYKGKIFIVDEASMITSAMASDFEASGAKVLFVGDPFQLPPVKSDRWFGGLHCDSMLTEVMRQALDNPIIRLSMEIRERGNFNEADYAACDEVILAGKGDLGCDEWLKADQCLTGSNALRRKINRFYRKQLGFSGEMPVEGEKLICLKNDFKRYNLINGVPATCIQSAFVDDDGQWRMSALSDDEVKADMAIYDYHFLAHSRHDAEELMWPQKRDLAEFDWGYAITVHKSQGSEWNNVLLADDGFWSGKRDRLNWLYTAITRAKNKLVWVMG